MPSKRSLEAALRALVETLERSRVPYMLVGGLAVSLRARPRFTHDIDATVAIDPDRIPALLGELAPRFRAAVPAIESFARRHGVLPLRGPGRIRVDLLLASHPFERGALRRATRLRALGSRVRVCTAEDLVAYKMGALRPQDVEDVAALLAAPRSGINRRRLDRTIRSLARDLGNDEILEVWLALFSRHPARGRVPPIERRGPRRP